MEGISIKEVPCYVCKRHPKDSEHIIFARITRISLKKLLQIVKEKGLSEILYEDVVNTSHN